MLSPERDLWYGTKGDPAAPIVIIGESWGREEAAQKRPFVGASGHELDRLLSEAGISRHDCLFTNLIAEQPSGNETFRFFTPKDSNPEARRIGGLIPSGMAIAEVQRLYRQLAHRPRIVVIAAGNWSLWGLSRRTGSSVLREANGRKIPQNLQTYAPNGILNYRGSMLYCEPHEAFGHLPPTPLLPIVHPAAIMREWYLRAPTLHDLRRVAQARHDDWRPKPEPTTLSPPSYDETLHTLRRWLNSGNAVLACDIETIRHSFISCIGFADSASFAISIPFIRDSSFESYWTPDQEANIIHHIRKIFLHPNIRIVGQNFIYDTQFIQHWFGVTPRLWFDTMLAQNVVFPGTPKDLGYLSSLYCRHHWYWKDDVKDWSRMDSLKTLLDYNCIDVLRTWEIADKQVQYIAATQQEEQMRFKMRTNALCLRMMNRGILIDSARRGSMLYELGVAQTAFYQELLQIVPQDMVNPNADKPWYRSAKQTAELFYDILGMQSVSHRKTGNRTVGKEALAVLERKYPEFTGLFRRLDYAGSVSNTINVIKTPVESDGRMRCSYNPGGTETHRLSSSENVFGRGTNLQNLTKGEEDD